ncbi:hypothetical protein TRAPUB_5047 [Trametes pubescens]|uniref:Protein kinase domain-containing protein n=1 Tax=Trametes pubescens TaxID=154538 RepID=A0A1M2V9P2_TRAPU|nr:hypothetical protein TRAPUB_5047 [Trametes pubescens]
MPKSPSRSPFNIFADLARSPARPHSPFSTQTGRPLPASAVSASILRPAAILPTSPASALSRSDAMSPGRHFSSNASPLTATNPAFDPRRTAFHEEPYMLRPEDGPYGYFPMQLGQKLCGGQYKVVRKLGYGTNSSVWLAKETMSDGYRYAVIKVMSTVATNAEYHDLHHEAAVAKSMSTFQTSDLAHPGYRHCAMIKRTFLEDSAHDVKLANILVNLGASTEQIDRFLANDPPQIYADSPPIDPRISPHSIPAIRSQPLPNFGLHPSYENLRVRLIDYGSGIPLGIKHRVGDQGTLETRFATLCDGLSAQDIGDTCRFLRKCLTIDPLARPTVSQLLQDAWLAT